MPPTFISVDKNEAYIPQEGGVNTITMLDDYDLWWIEAVHIHRKESTFDESCQCQSIRTVKEQQVFLEELKFGRTKKTNNK